MQAVATAGSPTGNHTDHDLGHHADQALDLEDVEAAGSARIDRLGGLARLAVGLVLVAVLATDALIAAGAERPAAVFRRRAVAGEQDAADVGRHAGVIERLIELVDGVWAEGVPDVGAVERNPDGGHVLGPVVRDVGELEAGHLVPQFGIEDVGHGVRRALGHGATG